MKDLIEALTIFAKYTNTAWPTHCEYDQLTICGISSKDALTPEEQAHVEALGFFWDDDGEAWISYRFGSGSA